MKKALLWTGLAALAALVLIAPAASGQKNKWPDEISMAELQRAQAKIERELARVERLLEEKLTGIERRIPSELEEKLAALEDHKLATLDDRIQQKLEAVDWDEMSDRVRDAAKRAQEALVAAGDGQGRVWISGDGETGWLGVSVDEVTAEKAKELKLAAERGVIVDDVDSDSPAAKAGLKKGDVITEFGGQRVEGVAQFRRYVRETPPGRSVAITVWRDGRAQQLNVTVGDMGDVIRDRVRDRITTVIPRGRNNWGDNWGNFSFSMPQIQGFSVMARPMLGIRTEDLDGQLGAYFGAPDNEGVLVTHVNTGSPAEKAGMKAGDVIVKVDGSRVRDTSDLRERMSNAREKKTVPVAVIRKGAETTLNVEIEQPRPAERPRVTRRINL